MQWINEIEERSFVLLTNLYIKSFFPRSGCSISYRPIWIFSHFCRRAKEYTVYRNLKNCFRWDDRYSNNFIPWVPPLTDSLTKQSNTWNKTKQSNRCIHSCSLYSRRDCGKQCWLVNTKTRTALRHSFTHYMKCNLSFHTVVTKIFIISSKNLKKHNQPINQPKYLSVEWVEFHSKYQIHNSYSLH